MTEADQRLIHAYVEPEGCWHEWIAHSKHELSYRGWYMCRWCGEERLSHVIPASFPYPDYSLPDNWTKLKNKLFGDERMWLAFTDFLDDKWEMEVEIAAFQFIPWLFSDYARFVALFAEFLRLEETVREFGWIICDGGQVSYPYCLRRNGCDCNGTGKILTPWARDA